MGAISELVLVVGPGQHPRLAELAEALAAEIRDLGVEAAVERKVLPARRSGRISVVFDPARLGVGRRPQAVGRRTLNGMLLVHAGGGGRWRGQPAFELDFEWYELRRSRGEPVEHLPVGWSQAWAASPGGEREIDIAIFGATDDDHFRLLARAAGELSRYRVHVAIAADPFARERGDDGYGPAERRAVLARSKVVVDLASREPPRVDGVLAAEAICAGAALVREGTRALAPLAPGRDYLAAGDDPISAALALLADPARRSALQSSASAAIEAIPLRSAAETLIAAAEALPSAGSRRPLPLADPRTAAREGPPPVTTDPDSAAARRRLKRVRLEQIELGRELDRLSLRLDGRPQDPWVELASPAAEAAEPRVSVLVTLFNYQHEIEGALDSVAASEFDSLELVVVDDASRDGSRAQALGWIDAHPEIAARLVVHPANLGLPSARNTALAHARGELVFILDADNRVLPHALGRLAEALDADPAAALAYGLAARVNDRGRPLGLMNLGGWDPARLRLNNYIDAMAMVRARALRELGGYTTELELYGWEDYDLWCRMAERGMRGSYVPEILAVYRSSYAGMAWSVSNISTTDAYRAVIGRAPKLMVGVEPPR